LAGDESGKGIIKTPISMASPSLTRYVGIFMEGDRGSDDNGYVRKGHLKAIKIYM
jgi:hypothetical protein